MSSKTSKLRLISAFAALLALALAVGCRGFFVKPTLTSLAVGPGTPTIYVGNTGNTVQMFAVGVFNDGSNSTTPVTWSISGAGTGGQNVATISAGGLVTAQSVGTGTITATSNVLPTVTGTQPLTVSVACTTAPIISPPNGQLTPTQSSITFTAKCGGQDVTAVASWFSSNSNIATVAAGVVTAVGGTGNDGTFFITATDNGLTSNQVSITASSF